MSYMGLRVGEVHTLNLSDYNAERLTLRVFGKGRKWRNVPVPEAVAPFLQQALNERLTPWLSKEEAMFISQKGRRLSIRGIQGIAADTFSRFQREVPTVHRRPYSSHKLRHSLPRCCCARGGFAYRAGAAGTFVHPDYDGLYAYYEPGEGRSHVQTAGSA